MPVQVSGTDTPTDGRGNTQTKRSLEVDVDAMWKVGQRDDIDVVAGLGLRRLNRRGFNETREALAIAVDGRIDPVADRDSRAGIRISFVDHRRCLRADGRKRAEQRRCCGRLHRVSDGVTGEKRKLLLQNLNERTRRSAAFEREN
jgi:hypothetical protein